MIIPKQKTAAAIRAAIDKAAKRKDSEARQVFLPAGVYSVKTKAIYLKKGVRIVCAA